VESVSNKILIISWGVFPDQNGSSVIIHNLARILKDKIVVVGELPDTVMEWDEIDYPLFHIDSNVLNTKVGLRYHKWLSFFKSFRKLNSIIREYKCIKIIAIFPDEYYLSLGYVLAKYNGIELYPWLHNTYIENRSGIFKLYAKLLQPRIFKYATKIFCISDGLTEYYKSKYRGLVFNTLRHAFQFNNKEANFINKDSKGLVKFAYSGSLNESCREASIRICKVISQKENCKLVVFGKRNVDCLIESGILSDSIQCYDFLEKDVFEQKLRICDFMILAHGFKGKLSDVEYDTIFPTRTVPLLNSGKPIIVHAHSSSFLTTWMRSNKCGYLICTEDTDEISKSIDRLIFNFDLQSLLIDNAKICSLLFDAKIIANELLYFVNLNNID